MTSPMSWRPCQLAPCQQQRYDANCVVLPGASLKFTLAACMSSHGYAHLMTTLLLKAMLPTAHLHLLP